MLVIVNPYNILWTLILSTTWKMEKRPAPWIWETYTGIKGGSGCGGGGFRTAAIQNSENLGLYSIIPFGEMMSSLGGDTHRVCDSWPEGSGFELCLGFFGLDIYQRCLIGLPKAWRCAKKTSMIACTKKTYLSLSSRVLSRLRFMSVADMSLTVTNGDVNLHSTNL